MYNELIFLIGTAAVIGAFLILGCLIISVFIVGGTIQLRRKGWSFSEAFKMARSEWQ